MSEQRSTLYAKLLGETAPICWKELEPFFARGAVLHVEAGLNLVEVATVLSMDEKAQAAAWLADGSLSRLSTERAQDWVSRAPDLWAVVVAPWVLVQERTKG